MFVLSVRHEVPYRFSLKLWNFVNIRAEVWLLEGRMLSRRSLFLCAQNVGI